MANFSSIRSKPFQEILIYLILAAASFAVLFPIFHTLSWPKTHEDARYLILLDQFRQAFLNGHGYPRWLPDLCGGYGYPTFVFYQPGFFYYSMLFSFLPGYPVLTMSLAVGATLFLGTLGVYKLTDTFSSANKPFAALTALLFLITPYIYTNLYVRGDLSELFAICLLPWPLYFLLKEKALGVVLTLSAVIVSHPAVTLFYVPVLIVLAVVRGVGLKERKSLFFLRMATAITAAFILSAPYWFYLFMMKQEVNYQSSFTGLFEPLSHLVFPYRLFERSWGFGVSSMEDKSGAMSFQLGLPHFILAVLGVLAGFRKKIVAVSFPIYLFLIYLMTPYASWVWQNIQILRYVQFPWRILSVLSILQVVSFMGLGEIFRKMGSLKSVFLAIILLSASIFWYQDQFQTSPEKFDAEGEFNIYAEHTTEKFYHLTQLLEYLPVTVRTVEFYPRGKKEIVRSLDEGCIARPLEGNNKYHLKYAIDCKESGTVQIDQFYMKGWNVMFDGSRIPEETLKEALPKEGWMRVSAPQGQHLLEASYSLPCEKWVFLGSILIGISLLIFLARSDRSAYEV